MTWRSTAEQSPEYVLVNDSQTTRAAHVLSAKVSSATQAETAKIRPGVAPWAFKGGARVLAVSTKLFQSFSGSCIEAGSKQPPVTVTGVAPWAFKKASAGASPRPCANRCEKDAAPPPPPPKLNSLEETPEAPVLLWKRDHSFRVMLCIVMQLCSPCRRRKSRSRYLGWIECTSPDLNAGLGAPLSTAAQCCRTIRAAHLCRSEGT